MLKAVRRNNNIFNVILQYNNLSGGNGGFAIVGMINKSKSIINSSIVDHMLRLPRNWRKTISKFCQGNTVILSLILYGAGVVHIM